MALRQLVEQSMTLDGERQPDIKDILQKTQFKFSRYILAVVFLLPGLVFIRKAYKRQPGIILNPRWAAIAADIIFVLFLGTAAYCVIAYGLKKFTGASPYLFDPIVMGMVTAVYAPITAFCGYFSSNFSSQSIEIGGEGIRIHYPGEVLTAPWDDIQGFELKDTYTIAGGIRFIAPRKMQTKLVVHTSTGDMKLFEPGLKKNKSVLISELRSNAPKRLQRGIKQLIKW